MTFSVSSASIFDRLDLKMMEESAKELAVSDLLAKAIDEAGKWDTE